MGSRSMFARRDEVSKVVAVFVGPDMTKLRSFVLLI